MFQSILFVKVIDCIDFLLCCCRVAWKVRCQDDSDIERYTKDCGLKNGKTFPPNLFKPGIIEPTKRTTDMKKSDAVFQKVFQKVFQIPTT